MRFCSLQHPKGRDAMGWEASPCPQQGPTPHRCLGGGSFQRASTQLQQMQEPLFFLMAMEMFRIKGVSMKLALSGSACWRGQTLGLGSSSPSSHAHPAPFIQPLPRGKVAGLVLRAVHPQLHGRQAQRSYCGRLGTSVHQEPQELWWGTSAFQEAQGSLILSENPLLLLP